MNLEIVCYIQSLVDEKNTIFLLAFGGEWAANAQPENIATLEAQLARSNDPVESIRLLEQLTNAMPFENKKP